MYTIVCIDFGYNDCIQLSKKDVELLYECFYINTSKYDVYDLQLGDLLWKVVC